MIKKTLLMALLGVSMELSAQQIDFDMTGRQSSEVTEEGYIAWPVTQGASDSRVIDGMTFTVSAAGSADVLRAQWSKNDVTSSKMRLVGDGVVGYILDGGGNTPNQTKEVMGVSVKIEGLSAGRHTFQGYHNGVNNYKGIVPIDVYVNGKKAVDALIQSENVASLEQAATSYVTCNVSEGEAVTITYLSHIESGKTYASTLVYLNAFVVDKNNTQAQAQAPSPANMDYHCDADDGALVLSWKGAPGTARHHIYLGTSADDLALVSTTSSAQYKATMLSPHNTYYWRVDEEDADGYITEGEVWSFRPRRLAFPGAEGYGKYAIGGRGGVVYHVTTLADNGDDANPLPGSLRYGIKQVKGPRTIVFDVAGVIALKRRLTCSDPYVTIAGQTAPGNGIMLRTSPFGMASDGITRFLRMRLGHKRLINGKIPDSPEAYGSDGDKTDDTMISGLDGMGMAGNDHSIMDHCSISWTIDEAFSSRSAHSITLQHTLISEALNIAGHPNYSSGTKHGYAATIGGGEMTAQLSVGSYHHNLLAHCEGRNWSLSGGLDGRGNYDGHHDIFNNVVYNWGGRATDGGSHEINFVSNFYKKGPSTSQNYLLNLQLEGTGTGTQSAYCNGNVRQETSGSMTQDRQGTTYKYSLSGGQKLDWPPFVSSPFFPSLAIVETAQAAYKNTLSDVGCTMPVLDNHDQRMIEETLLGTTSAKGSRSGKKGLIDSEEDTGCEGFEGLNIVSAQRPSDWDTDDDGMPDWWEKACGHNVAVADNNEDADDNGYTNLEDYLNWMALPHVTISGNGRASLRLQDYFAGYANNPRYDISADAELNADNNDGNLIITSKTGFSGFATVDVTATDSDGWGSLTRTFNVYVSSNNPSTGIVNLQSETSSSAQRDACLGKTPKPIIYNLNGQQVFSPHPGIYIRDGRKIVVH